MTDENNLSYFLGESSLSELLCEHTVYRPSTIVHTVHKLNSVPPQFSQSIV